MPLVFIDVEVTSLAVAMAPTVGTVAFQLAMLFAMATFCADAVLETPLNGEFRLQTDEWFEAQFTGHPKFACAKTVYPVGEKFQGYSQKFLLKTPQAPRNLYCVIKGSENDLNNMVRSLGLNTSLHEDGGGAQMLRVVAPAVICTSRPTVLASLFDLVVVSGRAREDEAWCLLARAPPPPHTAYAPRFPQPADGALAIRFRDDKVPDVVCIPDRRGDDETDSIDNNVDFFLRGLQEWSSPYFKCNFQRRDNATGPSADTLFLRLMLDLGLYTWTHRGRRATRLHEYTCREASPEKVPLPDDLLRQTGVYKDHYSVDLAITSPTGRTATCDLLKEDASSLPRDLFRFDVMFPGHHTLVCHSHNVPLGEDVDGTDFYFVAFMGAQYHPSKKFRCKLKNGEQLGGVEGAESVFLSMAQQMGVTVQRYYVEMGRVIPSVELSFVACYRVPPGFDHHFKVKGDFGPTPLDCAFKVGVNQTTEDQNRIDELRELCASLPPH